MLALVAPTLLLVAYGQAHQWARFRFLLGIAIVIEILGSVRSLYYVFPALVSSLYDAINVQTNDQPAVSRSLALAIYAALAVGPDVLLALTSLGFSVARARPEQVSVFTSGPDANLELRVEPVGRGTAG
jgi:hypothetical protein